MRTQKQSQKKNRRLYVLNVYSLKYIHNYILKNTSTERGNPFRYALIMCDDKTTQTVTDFRATIFPICKIDLGYSLGFNKSKFSFRTVGEYNKNIDHLNKIIKKDILSLSNKMVDYIKLRKHVYVKNIVNFTNDVEKHNNVEQFIEYYNEYVNNRKTNINSLINYMEIPSVNTVLDMSIKKFILDDLPERNPERPFVENLVIEVLYKLLKETNELILSNNSINITDYIQKTPIFESYENFVKVYRIAKLNNFRNGIDADTEKIINYFKDLIWKLAAGKYILTDDNLKNNPSNAWLIDLLNNENMLNVELTILRKFFNHYVTYKQTSHTSINSKFYNYVDSDALIYKLFKQMYILINYGNNIYGLY